jgi:hypothetical protein
MANKRVFYTYTEICGDSGVYTRIYATREEAMIQFLQDLDRVLDLGLDDVIKRHEIDLDNP